MKQNIQFRSRTVRRTSFIIDLSINPLHGVILNGLKLDDLLGEATNIGW